MPKPANVFTREDIPGELHLACDAVVIGSGAGGGVTAAELAEGGLDVIVLEEGGYHPTEEFSTDVGQALRSLYRAGGAQVALGSPPIQFAEGRCVGGSTVINGGMSWRTPEAALDRWHREDGIERIRADEMDPYFSRVEKYVSARGQDPGSIGRDNQLLRKGAEAKGWEVIPNIRGQHHCVGANYCAFGCPTSAKRSTLVSYIPRAMAFGARVYADCRVDRLITRGKRVTGVEGHVLRANGSRGPRFTVRAPIVVSSAGAIQTPALLMRSGVRSPSGRLGRNLSLHPNTKVVAIFDEDVRGWQGVHQAYQVREFRDQGFLMAAVTVPPSILSMGIPYRGAALDEVLKDYNRIVSGGLLFEDTVTGQVKLIPGVGPQAYYQLTDADAERMVRGTALMCELLFAAGARRVVLPFHGVPDLATADDARALAKRPIRKSSMEVMTVHIMGTACMGGDRARHVCDGWGKVYDADGLWVSDASLFPTPIGVNPAETIMALATRNAERILETKAHRRAA